MKSHLPTASDVQDQLLGLGHAQLHKLSRISGVPYTTLHKIRAGVTRNPGIMTVRQFLPFVDRARVDAAGRPECVFISSTSQVAKNAATTPAATVL